MKKYLIILLLSFIILPSVISAQTSLSDAGLLPDSSFYFLKSWKESIQIFFTFNAENKAKQYLYLAEVRLAEYQKMLEKGKADIAEKTLTKYQSQLNRALSKTEEIKQKGKDIKNLSQQIEETASKHLEVLQENLEKVPETAKKGIETAIDVLRKEESKISKTKEKIKDQEFVEQNLFIKIISPNGGEKYTIGQEIEIRWSVRGDDIQSGGFHLCEIFSDKDFNPATPFDKSKCIGGGDLYLEDSVAEKEISMKSAKWIVGKIIDGGTLRTLSPQSGKYYLLTEGYYGDDKSVVYDFSDKYFQIIRDETTPFLTVIYPNDAEKLEVSNNYTIKWQHPYEYAGKNIFLKIIINGTDEENKHIQKVILDDKQIDIPITIPSFGEFDYLIPSDFPSGNYKITVFDDTRDPFSSNPRRSDESDNSFSIKSFIQVPTQSKITVLSPNGGEQWMVGNIYEITWISTSLEKVNIALQHPNGALCHLAIDVPASLGKYSFKLEKNYQCLVINAKIIDGEYQAYIYGTGNYTGYIQDESDASFKITGN